MTQQNLTFCSLLDSFSSTRLSMVTDMQSPVLPHTPAGPYAPAGPTCVRQRRYISYRAVDQTPLPTISTNSTMGLSSPLAALNSSINASLTETLSSYRREMDQKSEALVESIRLVNKRIYNLDKSPSITSEGAVRLNRPQPDVPEAFDRDFAKSHVDLILRAMAPRDSIYRIENKHQWIWLRHFLDLLVSYQFCDDQFELRNSDFDRYCSSIFTNALGRRWTSLKARVEETRPRFVNSSQFSHYLTILVEDFRPVSVSELLKSCDISEPVTLASVLTDPTMFRFHKVGPSTSLAINYLLVLTSQYPRFTEFLPLQETLTRVNTVTLGWFNLLRTDFFASPLGVSQSGTSGAKHTKGDHGKSKTGKAHRAYDADNAIFQGSG